MAVRNTATAIPTQSKTHLMSADAVTRRTRGFSIAGFTRSFYAAGVGQAATQQACQRRVADNMYAMLLSHDVAGHLLGTGGMIK